MTYRLNILAIASVFLVLLFFLNNHRVPVQVLFISANFPLGGLMAFCVGVGVVLTLLFLSLGRSYRRLLNLRKQQKQ
ncbi:MAG: LapA family protein [Turneriella sp.]|nr:LapA family protein [Leptospiraceae bacterium]MCX7633222.1 LapA family protein [Turneriella sp.]